MVVWKLQTVGAGQVPFLDDQTGDRQVILLKPGVAYSLQFGDQIVRRHVDSCQPVFP
jgi:hypothetical protein